MTLSLIFMGSSAFALPALRVLAESDHSVAAVYCARPKPAGRGQQERVSPVHAFALERGLRVLTPSTLKTEDAVSLFKSHGADAAVVASYGLILPQPILDTPRLGCINVHPSLLPRWRGAAPIQRTIMAGDTETGIVIMQMDIGLDTGDMLLKENIQLHDGMTAGELHDLLAEKAAPLVLDTLKGLERNDLNATPQSKEGICYAQKIAKEDCRINWNHSAHAIRQQILGLSPHPGAFFMYKAEAIKVLNARIADDRSHEKSPATVWGTNSAIQCGLGAIEPLMIQRPGKKPMSYRDMLLGFPLPAGTMLA